MTIEIQDPTLAELIQDDIRNKRFLSPDHLIAVALQHFYAETDDDEFDDATAAEIAAACERAARGERGYSIEEAREMLLGLNSPPVRP